MDATIVKAEFRGPDIPEGHVAITFRAIIASSSPEHEAFRASIPFGVLDVTLAYPAPSRHLT